ncbi:MAG: hypothetical protein R2708_27160 [Vicinamibacterales bacterium]
MRHRLSLPSPGGSLRFKLLAPMATAWVALAVVALAGVTFEAQRRLEHSLVRQAEVLANLVNYSAESVADPADLQRFVTKASAEPNVLAIVVAAGTPARVVASSRSAWNGLLVSELPQAEIADDLDFAHQGAASRYHFHTGEHRFDYSAPLLLSLPTLADGTLAEGAVALHLDTQALQDDILRSAGTWTALVLVGAAAFTALGYVILHRRVLRPLAAIGWAMRHHDEEASWAEARTGDELEDLARTVRDAIQARARSEAAMRLAERMASVGALAGGVAHEVNTPLQYLSDSVHFLRDASHDVLGALDQVGAAVDGAADAPAGELRAVLDAVAAHIQQADLPYLLDHLPRAATRSLEGIERVQSIVQSLRACADVTPRDMQLDDINRAVKNALTVVDAERTRVAAVETAFGDLPPVRCHVGDVYHAARTCCRTPPRRSPRRRRPPRRRPGAVASRWRRGATATRSWSPSATPDAASRPKSPIVSSSCSSRPRRSATGRAGPAEVRRIVTDRHGGRLTFSRPPSTLARPHHPAADRRSATPASRWEAA